MDVGRPGEDPATPIRLRISCGSYAQIPYVDGSRLRRMRSISASNGRVQSYVGPSCAVPLTAGPDGVRWSGPYQDYALVCP
jgi:hypothetical protein